MRRIAVGAALVVAATALSACGDGEGSTMSFTDGQLETISTPDISPGGDPPPVVDADRARIADAINEVRDDLAARDYAGVCDNLAADGAVVLQFAEQGDPPADFDSCEEALEAFLADPGSSDLRDFVGKGPYRAADVEIDIGDDPSLSDSTDAVPEGGEQEVQVSSLEEDGNAYVAVHQTDGSWKLALPFPSGR